LEQHDQTNPNPNKEHVIYQEGVSNDIGDNNKKDNSTEVTSIRRDNSVPQPKDKDNSITKPSQARDFLEDPLIKECDPSHRCIIENKKFIACLKVSGEGNFPAVWSFFFIYQCTPYINLTFKLIISSICKIFSNNKKLCTT